MGAVTPREESMGLQEHQGANDTSGRKTASQGLEALFALMPSRLQIGSVGLCSKAGTSSGPRFVLSLLF